MNIVNIEAKLTQLDNNSGIAVTLYLTREQKELFILENGVQPNCMIEVKVTEVI